MIEEVLQGLSGVKNVMDDILIYGRGVQEHDERLMTWLKRLEEKGLTVNHKCVVGVGKVEFFGLEFSKDGIRLTESKVKALVSRYSNKYKRST